MQPDVVLDVQVRSPVAKLNRALELGDFEHGMVVLVMYDDRSLHRIDEILRGGRNVVVRSVCYRCTRLGDGYL